jgi:hypothetical protein
MLVALVAAGVQVLGPASAAAEDDSDTGTESRCVLTVNNEYRNLDTGEVCEPEAESGGGTGGGEVIRVVDDKPFDPYACNPPGSIFCQSVDQCENPGVLCITDPWSARREKMRQKELEDEQKARERKRKEDQQYVACMKERKRYMLASQKPLCPVYCPAQKKYVSPTEDCIRVNTEGAKPKLSTTLNFQAYLKTLKTCHRLGTQIADLEDLHSKLKAKYPTYEQIWHAHHYDDRTALKQTQWGLLGCDQVYDDAI